jgi:signal transduction histidine kinase
MSDIGSSLRRHWLEIAWGVFAAANVAVIFLLSQWETVPFHFVWVSLTLLYGYRVWSGRTTTLVLVAVIGATGASLLWSVMQSTTGRPDELTEVPLMAAMFVAMVWHARRRLAAMEEVRRLADAEHRLLERQREFVRDASHELRTPITVARGHAELVRASDLSKQARHDVEVVLDELDRLTRISERLLILAAAEHPGFLRPVPVAMPELVGKAVDRWKPTADRVWEVRVADGQTIVADPDRLESALDALFENALKFTDPGGTISVVAHPDDGRVLIEVADTGEGIPADQLGRIFDRFARADGGRARRTGGTGLGLAIVKAIAEAHGGTVAAASSPGQGSAFQIRLPRGGDGTEPGYRQMDVEEAPTSGA